MRVVVTAHVAVAAIAVAPVAGGVENDERVERRGAAAEHCPVAEPPPPAARRAPLYGHAPCRFDAANHTATASRRRGARPRKTHAPYPLSAGNDAAAASRRRDARRDETHGPSKKDHHPADNQRSAQPNTTARRACGGGGEPLPRGGAAAPAARRASRVTRAHYLTETRGHYISETRGQRVARDARALRRVTRGQSVAKRAGSAPAESARVPTKRKGNGLRGPRRATSSGAV